MQKTSYNVIVKAVAFGAPALAEEVINDLNATLEKLDTLERAAQKATETTKTTKKKEN